MESKGVSIIITAYNTANYIEECLDSIYDQSWFKKHRNWEVLLGIDHCKETLKKVVSIMEKYPNLRVFYMVENVGTYITSNTIILNAKYDKVLRFDSDDVMKDNMVETMVDCMQDNIEIVQCYYKNFVKDKTAKGTKDIAHGVFLCKKSVFTKYGGFMPWKCAADTEFHERLKRKVHTAVSPEILFYRRIHESSLTRSEGTSFRSKLRAEYKFYIRTTSPTVPVIKTKTAFCKEICINSDIEDFLLEPEEAKIEIKKPYVKRVIPNAKVIKKTLTNTYIGV
jgi:glycosyltransferase involved in cell wall biosynthesis